MERGGGVGLEVPLRRRCGRRWGERGARNKAGGHRALAGGRAVLEVEAVDHVAHHLKFTVMWQGGKVSLGS